jgi:quercetin dioxygenase-like cupin family protein
MSKEFFPEFIRNLPETDIPIKGIHGWLVQNKQILVSILENDEAVEVGEHSHGDQFGIVLCGKLDITIGGKLHHFTKGDSYFIPAGVKHSAKLSADHRALDFFADIDRYKPKGK